MIITADIIERFTSRLIAFLRENHIHVEQNNFELICYCEYRKNHGFNLHEVGVRFSIARTDNARFISIIGDYYEGSDKRLVYTRRGLGGAIESIGKEMISIVRNFPCIHGKMSYAYALLVTCENIREFERLLAHILMFVGLDRFELRTIQHLCLSRYTHEQAQQTIARIHTNIAAMRALK